MKTCPNCGLNAEDTSIFCPGCGTKLDAVSDQPVSEEIIPDAEQTAEVPAQPATDAAVGAGVNNTAGTEAMPQNQIPASQNTYQQNGRGYVEYGQMYARPNVMPYGMPSGPALSTMKKVLSSPLALVIAIGYSLTVLLQYISILITMATDTSIFSSLSDEYGLPYEIRDIFNAADKFIDSFKIFYVLPLFITATMMLVIAIGMWTTYIGALGKNNPSMGTGGLTAIKVIVVIRLVSACIAFLAPLIMIIVGIASAEDLGSEGLAALIGSAFIAILILVLLVLYYAKQVKTINVIKGTAKTGIANNKVSTFVAVMLIISGIFSFIGMILSAVFGSDALSVISSLITSIITLLLGVLVFVYRGKMSDVIATAGYPAQMPVNYPHNYQ